MMTRALIVVLVGTALGGSMDGLISTLGDQLGQVKEDLHENDLIHAEKSTQLNSAEKQSTSSLSANTEDFNEYTSNQKASEAAAKAALQKKRKANRSHASLVQQISNENADANEDSEECAVAIADLQGSVSALFKALGSLKSGSGSVDLMQVNDPRVAKAISLLGRGGKSYGSKNAGVIDLVSDMHDDFKKQMNEKEIACMNVKNNHAMEVQSLQNQANNQQKTEKDQNLAQTSSQADAADAGAAAAVSNGAMNADQAAIRSAQAAAAEENHRYGSESDELNNLKNGLVKGIATLKSEALLLQKSNPMFLQLATAPKDLKEKIVALLDQGALAYKSRALAQLAVRVSAAGGFKKIVEMMEDMIANLQKEAAEDAAKNAGCVTDLAQGREDREVAKLARETADGEFNKQAAKIDELSAKIGDTSAQIKHLTESLANSQKIETQRKHMFTQSQASMTATSGSMGKAMEQLQATKQGAADQATKDSLEAIIKMIGGTFTDVKQAIRNAAVQDTKDSDAFSHEKSHQTAEKKAKNTFKGDLTEEQTGAQAKKEASEEERENSTARQQDAQKRLDATNALCRPPPIPLKQRLAQRNNEIKQLGQVMKVLRDSHN